MVSSNLQRLFDTLDAFDRPLRLRALVDRIRSARITFEDVVRAARFGRSCYRRNLIHTGPTYQALVLCWRSGQRSPIHDHSGSTCVVRVLKGTATETRFAISECGLVYPVNTKSFRVGSVTGSFDQQIHQMGNLRPAGDDLVTLHIYSPPLLSMRTYYPGNAVLGEDDGALRASIRARAARLTAY